MVADVIFCDVGFVFKLAEFVDEFFGRCFGARCNEGDDFGELFYATGDSTHMSLKGCKRRLSKETSNGSH
jgi:hypothetical protein